MEYYTPKIEELFVGYECQRYSGYGSHVSWTTYNESYWSNYIIKEEDYYSDSDGDSDIREIIEDLKNNRLQTKYLDKEDIMNEGWMIDSAYSLKKDGWYIECNLNNIKSDTIHIFLEQDKRFDGKIKSINEFKKIIKWIYQ